MVSVLLFSGGIDSTLLASVYRPDLLLFIDYGQVCAQGELKAASQIAGLINIPLEKLHIALGGLGIGRLSGQKSSSSFWPLRNQALLTLAAMRFSSAKEIWIGTSPKDIYKDCTSEFISAFSNLLAIQNSKTKVSAPLFETSFSDLVKKLPNKGILNLTFSCHSGELPCGNCAGCKKNATFLQDHLH